MSPPASRRRLLAGLVALPFAGGGAASIGFAPDVPDAEAGFLALVPSLLPKLREYDRIWAEAGALFDAAWRGGGDGSTPTMAEVERSPEWAAYLVTRKPADAIEDELRSLLDPLMDEPMRSPRALAFQVRILATLDAYEIEWSDLGAAAEAWLCA